MSTDPKVVRLRGLAGWLRREVPEAFWETGMLPALRGPANQGVRLEELAEIEWSDTWPYQQATLAGRRAGITPNLLDAADVLSVYWPGKTPTGLDERKLYLPATPMSCSQYEVHLQLRRDGTDVTRAAELAAQLG